MNAKIEWLEGPAPQTLGAITQLWLLKLTRKTPGSSYDTVAFKYVTTDSLAVVNAEAKKMWDAAAAIGQQVVSVCWEAITTKEKGCFDPSTYFVPQFQFPQCTYLVKAGDSLEYLGYLITKAGTNFGVVNQLNSGKQPQEYWVEGSVVKLPYEICILLQNNLPLTPPPYVPRIPISRQPELVLTTQPYIPQPPMSWQPRLATVTVNTEFNDGHLPGAIRFLALRGVEWLGENGMLGAAPSIIKKWFPERTDAEWDNLNEADKFTLQQQANLVEAEWNGKINEMRYNGACDATKPGLLAGAMREHLIKSGGKLANMDDLGAKSFGPKDCAEWWNVFGKAPDQETVAKAIGLVTGSTSVWVKNSANNYTRQITLNSVCPGGFKLPSCPSPGGGGGGGPECSETTPCSADKDCVDSKCVDKCPPNYTRDVATGLCKLPTPTTGGASGVGPLGVVLLAGAALGAIYLAMRGVGTNLPPQPGRSMKDNPCNCQLP